MSGITYYLDVTSINFTAEDHDDPDGPHVDEHWRLEFFPRGERVLPREDVIFVHCKKNNGQEDAFENQILRAEEGRKHEMMIDFATTTFHQKGWHNFRILNSLPVELPAPRAMELPFDYRIVPYTSLERCEEKLHAVHPLVNFEGVTYVMKGVAFPDEVFRIYQELSHYKSVSTSKWIPEIGGVVSRQGRHEAMLVRFCPGGDLRGHFDADDESKRRWVVQLATALTNLNSMNFFHRNLKCANIVLDEHAEIRIIDLENSGGTKAWTHPENLNIFISMAEQNPHMVLSVTPGEARDLQPPFPNFDPTHTRDEPGLPLPVSEFAACFLPSPIPTHSVAEKRRFQVYCFGKTVWELYTGKAPLNDDDLTRIPVWARRLILGCCKEDVFASMEEGLAYLASDYQ
jgi:serine/threonine protein kinase